MRWRSGGSYRRRYGQPSRANAMTRTISCDECVTIRSERLSRRGRRRARASTSAPEPPELLARTGRSRGRRGGRRSPWSPRRATSPASTSAAPARMSVASTGAPESIGDAADHGVVTVGADVGAEPGELVDEQNRASKRFSVIIAVPSATALRPARTAAGRSGTPGRAASRRRRRAAGRRSRTRNPSSRHRRPSAPARGQLVQRDLEVLGHGRRRRARHRGSIAAANAQVPATIRSGDGRVLDRVQPRRRPRSSRVEVPTPVDLGAHRDRASRQMSTISGSRAALSMTVVPVASTAAIRMFSVAPTLGKSSQMSAPRSPCGASATRKPCSTCERRAERAPGRRCACRGRASRSRRRRAARRRPAPQRATSGPSTQIEARSRRTRS